jgi:type III secretion system FlhB-like substrate exporter
MIPAELYGVIAEVLAWAYRANSAYRPAGGGPREL